MVLFDGRARGAGLATGGGNGCGGGDGDDYDDDNNNNDGPLPRADAKWDACVKRHAAGRTFYNSNCHRVHSLAYHTGRSRAALVAGQGGSPCPT